MHATRHFFIADRYELGEKLASTALGDVFCAHDFIRATADDSLHPVLLFAVAPQVVAYPNFHDVMPKILAEFGKKNPLLQVIEAHEYQGVYWIAIDENYHDLLIHQLPQQKPANLASALEGLQPLLIKALEAVKRLNPKQGFGFIEPGALLFANNTFKLINAPVAFTLQILASANPDKKPDIALHSPYCSPQVAHGLVPTPQDDTFAIGCIAYHALHGAPPFANLSTLEAYAQQQRPHALTHLKPESQKSLQRALALERYERQPSPYELVHAFVSIPTDTLTTESVYSAQSAALFRPLPLAASLAVMLLLGLGFYQLYQQPETFLTAPASIAHQHQALTAMALPAVAPPENNTPTPPEPQQPTDTQTTATTPTPPAMTAQITPEPITTPRRVTTLNTAPPTARTPPKPIITATASAPKRPEPPRITASPNITKTVTAPIAAPPRVIATQIVPPPPIAAPRPPPATVVIPVAENTFVVGQSATLASIPNRKVQATSLESRDGQVFVVVSD